MEKKRKKSVTSQISPEVKWAVGHSRDAARRSASPVTPKQQKCRIFYFGFKSTAKFFFLLFCNSPEVLAPGVFFEFFKFLLYLPLN